MTSNKDFFREKQPAAVFKHKLLRDYMTAWAAKMNSFSPLGSAFIDGYAGQGRYEGNVAGSPAIALDIARRGGGSKLQCVFVEKDPAVATKLRQVIAEEGRGLNVFGPLVGTLEDQLELVLDAIGAKPALFFLDPFGTALSPEVMKERILGRQARSTEVLLNFNIEAVWRMGGALKITAGRRGSEGAKTIAAADRFLGGDWWHGPFIEARKEAEVSGELGPAAAAAASVAREYQTRVAADAGYEAMSVPVRRNPTTRPFFSLMLFHQHPGAKLLFADSAARAHKVWREDFWDRYAEKQFDENALFNQEAAPLAESENKRLDQECIDHIGQVIRNRISREASIYVPDAVEDLFGKYLGTAFEKHLRAAWRKEANAGLVQAPPKRLATATIRRV